MTKLKSVRMSTGLTQAQLAALTGLNLRTLQYYEQGNKKIEHAKLETILKICQVLNVEMGQIIDDEGLLYLYNKYFDLLKDKPDINKIGG